MVKKTTEEERRRYIEQPKPQERDQYGRRILPADRTFLDHDGQIVHPNKVDYESKRKDKYKPK
ncbi:hypothetical protein J4408_02105 [Candidatus Pacearchaeota archaeon]|nr:hypothetical protein [Candidatus Pacearchaeota archaeon]